MKNIRLIMTAVLAMASMLVCIAHAEQPAASPSDAEFEALLAEEAHGHIYKFPEIKPEYGLSLGYRSVGGTGSQSSAADYEYLSDSMMLGADMAVFAFPSRFSLIFDGKNKHDYFGDLRYAYGDALFMRWLTRSVHHNNPNLTLYDLDTATSYSRAERLDAGDSYSTASAMDNVFLRLKTDDFPAHAYFNYFQLRKDGDIQDVSLQGSGYYDNMVRTSRRRNVNRHTESYSVGANSHLAFVEAEIQHSQKRFDPDGDYESYDNYTTSARPAGRFRNGMTPRLDGKTNTIKLHSSYTGRFVATGTFSVKERENKSSGAKTDYIIGTGGVMWMPDTNVRFSIGYSRRDMNAETPATVTVTDANDSSNAWTYAVKRPLEYTTDTFAVSGNYSPYDWLVIKGRYNVEEIKRRNASEWAVTGSTTKTYFLLSGAMRSSEGAKLDASFKTTHIENPAYNTEPDDSKETNVSLGAALASRTRLFLSYGRMEEEREYLTYKNSASARNRDVNKDKYYGSATFMLSDSASMDASAYYMNNKITQDVGYYDSTGSTRIAKDTHQRETSRNYSIGASYAFNERASFRADASRTSSRGTFDANTSDLLGPVPVAAFMDYAYAMVELGVDAGYKISKNYNASLEYTYSDMDETMDNPYDDIEEGNVQIVMLKLSGKW